MPRLHPAKSYSGHRRTVGADEAGSIRLNDSVDEDGIPETSENFYHKKQKKATIRLTNSRRPAPCVPTHNLRMSNLAPSPQPTILGHARR
jgi:hypothetical protein